MSLQYVKDDVGKLLRTQMLSVHDGYSSSTRCSTQRRARSVRRSPKALDGFPWMRHQGCCRRRRRGTTRCGWRTTRRLELTNFPPPYDG